MYFETWLDRVIQISSEYAPRVLSALLILGLGWAFGRIIGGSLAKLVKSIGIEDRFNRTILGKALRRSRVSFSAIVGLLTRWFIYLAAILLASDVMGLAVFSSFIRNVTEYIPYLIAGLLILTIGIIAADLVSDTLMTLGEEMGVELSRLFAFALRLFLYFTVTVVALTVMKVDVSILYIFANAMSWGLAIGAGIALGIAFGWGLKDVVSRNAGGIIRGLGAMLGKVSTTVDAEALRAKVKELEDELARYRRRVEMLERMRAPPLEELERPVANLHDKLKEVVRDTGRVRMVAGGYEVEVIDPIAFPWCSVLLLLQNNGFDVWFSRRDKKYLIMAKAPSW